MGLWGGNLDFRLPNALPALPRPRALPFIEVEAIRRRVDLQVARIEIDALAKSLGMTQATRFINLLEVIGIGKSVRERETGERTRSRGFEIEFQIPIFDFGEVRVRQADHTYMEAVNRLAEKAINVRSEARDAYRIYRSTYDIAMHYRRDVLPLHKIKADETLLRYNAMQIDVFALLEDARRRIAATSLGIEAQRDFWLAATDLSVAVTGGGVGGPAGAGPRFIAGAEAGAVGH
jgi:outer membrane protein TolC